MARGDYDKFSSKEQVDFEIEQHKSTLDGVGKLKKEKALKTLCENINECAPIIKHSSFHEELEWRIVARNPAKNIKYRVSKSHIVPFLILPIIKKYPEIIRKICIGPNPNPNRCAKSVEQLLTNEGLNNIEIEVSEIPFNSW